MKVDDVELHDRDLNEFKNQIRDFWNFGKYQIPIITSLPTWAARPGEFVLFQPTSGGTTQYVYYGSAWVSTWSSTL